MIIPKRYKYCGKCGKELKVTNNGRKLEGYDRDTGKPLFVREYLLVCPNYSFDPTTEFITDGERHDTFVYHEPIE